MFHELFHAGVFQCAGLHLVDQRFHDYRCLTIQGIPPLSLLPIELRQLIAEDLLGQTGLDLGDALLGQVAGLAVGAVADHMHMGVVGLIVEGGVPPELVPGDLHGLGHLYSTAGEQDLPLIRVIVAQPGGVLPPQG